MAKSLNGLTEIQIAKRIKEGRGQGSGANYKPWLRIHEVPSQGLSHRIYSFKTKRTHHLMCAEKTGGFNLVNYRHSSGVYHEQETEDLHRRI